MRHVVESHLDIDDVLYHSPSGPIAVSDVIYGWARQIETSGVDFYAHKTGFTTRSLQSLLLLSGFPYLYVCVGRSVEIKAIAFKREPTAAQRDLLGLPTSKESVARRFVAGNATATRWWDALPRSNKKGEACEREA